MIIHNAVIIISSFHQVMIIIVIIRRLHNHHFCHHQNVSIRCYQKYYAYAYQYLLFFLADHCHCTIS